MATPNYSYEKRQRELAKKRKTEEKRNRKAQAPRDDLPAGDGSAPPVEAEGGQPPQADPVHAG
jgi:hypothetical protein